ncbi:MAG: DUF2927 domain-containing protein [Halocynthiibacter sp.]
MGQTPDVAPARSGPVRHFSAGPPPTVTRSTQSLTQDFIDLSFRLESGKRLSHFSRYETPIRVYAPSTASPILLKDLSSLLQRLRSEAKIDIRRVADKARANLFIEPLGARIVKRYFGNAACLVAPNETSWASYKAKGGAGPQVWQALRERRSMAIFLPKSAAPQEIRDCLHEEIAQAIGPVNDLYRLSDSVFNDDNVNVVLTATDMLFLRAYYAPELKTGMSQDAVARRLSQIFGRINPKKKTASATSSHLFSAHWKSTIERALRPGLAINPRINAARQAVNIAQNAGYNDARLGFSYYAYARLMSQRSPREAHAILVTAQSRLKGRPEFKLHLALIELELAKFALAQGGFQRVDRLTRQIGPVFQTHQNAAALSVALYLRAEALNAMGQTEQARKLRLEASSWGRYGLTNPTATLRSIRDLASAS